MSTVSAAPMLGALLAAVRETPLDDAPRLVLADWLMDQDDPTLQARGEFIALQCRLPSGPQQPALIARQHQLWAEHRMRWLGPLAGLNVEAQRGMLHLHLSATRLGDTDLAVLASASEAAWLTGLTITEVSPRAVEQLANCPLLAHILDLRLQPRSDYYLWLEGSGGVGDIGVSALAASRHIRPLSSLSAPSCGLTPARLQVLAKSRALSRPAILELDGNPLGNDGALVLAGTSRLGQVRRLSLANTRLGDYGLIALARSLNCGPLQTLHLSNNPIGTEGCRTLAEIHLPHLVDLDLSETGIGGRGIRSLARSSVVSNLVSLRLRQCRIGDTGALALASASHMSSLRELDLEGNSIYPEGAFALADARHLRRLRSLRLGHNLIGSEAARALRMIFDDRVWF